MRTKINKKSDFDFIVLDSEGNPIPFPTDDFSLFVWTWGSKCRFKASSIKGVLAGCKNEDNKLRVFVDNPGFVPGKLVGELVAYITNDTYDDGSQRTCRYISDFGIDMVNEDSETNEVQVLAMMQYIQGASAYEIACEYGYQGTEEEWLASLSLDSRTAANECRELVAEFTADENVRELNEATRLANEAGRIAAENKRVEEFAEMKSTKVTPEMLSESTKQYINASGGGTITNLADDEDLTSVDNVLKLADKDYSPTSYSGMGRVYLRKNMVDGKNILTQEMMTKENTIYIIQYDYDLNGATINVPSGCVLDFQGGSLGNGTLNLNDARITNRGICCDISNITKDYRYPLSFYLGNTDNPTLNKNVVQALLNDGINLIIDYTTIEFDSELFVGTIRITTLGNRKSTLNFPNSRGFVWNKQIYSIGNNIQNISVNSKGHCFDFCNSGDANRPRNVFDSIFYNISAVSAEGDCFNSGFDNTGSSGDNLSFSNSFNEVAVKASAGCGFVGQTSNTTEFRNIIDNGCAVSLFHNCAGTFRECNGTFGVSTTFFKLTPKSVTIATSVSVLFEDCNLEGYKGVLFDCPSRLTYIDLTMRNCSLYITPNSDGLVDYYPLNLGVVQNFDFVNNRIKVYNSGTYASGYALLKCNATNPTISPNTTVTYYDIGNYKHECVRKNYSISAGITKSTFNAEVFNNQVNLNVERNLKYGILIPSDNNIEISKNTGIDIRTAYEVFRLTCPTDSDVEGNSYWLYYINISMFDTPIAHYGYRFMLYNGTSNTTFKIAHNQGYSGRFIVDVGENYMLKPKDHVWVKVVVDENGKYYSYVETNHLAKYYLSGSSRPTMGLYNGKQFFDTTLGKPIWWNGSAWVDSTGAVV